MVQNSQYCRSHWADNGQNQNSDTYKAVYSSSLCWVGQSRMANWIDHHITRSKSTGIFMVDSYFYIRTVFKSAAENVLILFKRKWKRVCTVGVMPHQFNVITSSGIAKNEYWIVKQGITVY